MPTDGKGTATLDTSGSTSIKRWWSFIDFKDEEENEEEDEESVCATFKSLELRRAMRLKWRLQRVRAVD